MVRCAIVLALLSACTSKVTYQIAKSEFQRPSQEPTDLDAEIELKAIDGTSISVRGDTLLSAEERGAPTVSVRELFELCGSASSDASCPLDHSRSAPVAYLSRKESDPEKGVGYFSIGLAVVAAGAAGYCTFKCDSPWNYISGGGLIVTGVIVTAGVLMSRPPPEPKPRPEARTLLPRPAIAEQR